MSKYETAISVKQKNDRMIQQLNNQICDGRRDKTGLDWYFSKQGDRQMVFITDMYHGYYGSSSVSSDRSEDVGKEIAKTLTQLVRTIVQNTVDRLEKETKQALFDAKAEAEQIIESCKS